MSIQLSKSHHYLFLLAICLTNIVVMHDYIVMPVANNLYELFPNSIAGVNFILSGPAVLMFFASLLAPAIMKHTGKKTMLCIACIIFTFASVFGSAIVSVPYMIAARSICGFCYGLVQVSVMNIVADYFIDEDKRASFMGIYNAAMAAIGALMGIAAGNLAVTGWQNAYRTYWAAIPMTILVILFVPNIKSASVQEAAAGDQQTTGSPLGSRFWIALCTFFIFNLCYTPMLMMASVYIAENSLGNESVAGLAASLGTIGSCICCLVFGFLYSKFKARTSMISFIIMAAGLLGMYFLPQKFLFLGICTICGGAYGMMFSYVYAHIPGIVPPDEISRAISFLTAATGLSTFISTYVITALMGIVPGNSVTCVCLLLGLVLTAAAIVEFINTRPLREN